MESESWAKQGSNMGRSTHIHVVFKTIYKLDDTNENIINQYFNIV